MPWKLLNDRAILDLFQHDHSSSLEITRNRTPEFCLEASQPHQSSLDFTQNMGISALNLYIPCSLFFLLYFQVNATVFSLSLFILPLRPSLKYFSTVLSGYLFPFKQTPPYSLFFYNLPSLPPSLFVLS